MVLHTVGVLSIKVDNTSVLLLVISIVCLLAPSLTKIRFGELEAEIAPQEVKQLKEKVTKHIPKPTQIGGIARAGEQTRLAQAIIDLSDIDPVLALAKLRIELEKVLTALYQAAGTPESSSHPVGVSGLIRKLTNMEIVPRGLSSAITGVVQLCNRAIHGEDIRTPQAKTIVDQGCQLLKYLYEQLSEFRLEPKDIQEINKEDIIKYRKAKYKVVTVIPYVDKPLRNTRILNQEAFDRLLEGYEEYGEFIVEVSKIVE